MSFELTALPYDRDALAPIISAETIDYHYGKHHQAYVTNLNKLLPGTEYENSSLEDIIRTADGGIFNNAAQMWNHTFYWNCLTPDGRGEPGAALDEAIKNRFGSFNTFLEAFNQSATTNFGSGWTWLVKTTDGGIDIVNTSNAGNPLRENLTPLMTIDVWEHAYYIDYRNERAKYLDKIWKIINWQFVAANFD